jgi:hypothetical protein
VDHPRALDLPERRLLGVVLAGLAGGVHAAVEHGERAARTVGACRRHPRFVGGVETQRVDETVAEIVAEIHGVGIGDLAVGLGQPDVALGLHPLGGFVVDHPVGFDGGAGIINLHIANGRDALVVGVVVDLDRLQQHRGLVALRRGWRWSGLGDRRPLGKAHDLALRGRNIQPAAGHERCRTQQNQGAWSYSFTPH